MVVIKLVVKDPSEKRKRRQLLPTPATSHNKQSTQDPNLTCKRYKGKPQKIKT
jgi:hypothetical protein